jgi:serine/threonine protein phosphatase PrpC
MLRKVPVGPLKFSLHTILSSLTAASPAAQLRDRLMMVQRGEVVTRADSQVGLRAYCDRINLEKLTEHKGPGVADAAHAALAFLATELQSFEPVGGQPPLDDARRASPPPIDRAIVTNEKARTIDRFVGIYGATDLGGRDDNEDSIGISGEFRFLGDGMGAHSNGAEASGLAAKTVLDSHGAGPAQAIRNAHDAMGPGKSGPGKMGTTAIVYKVDKSGRGVAAAVGDSRLYILRADGTLELFNLPENLGFMLLKKNVDSLFASLYPELTADPEKAAKKAKISTLFSATGLHDEKAIILIDELLARIKKHAPAMLDLQFALGHDMPDEIAEIPFTLQPGDTIFAVCDGMTLDPAEIKKIFQEEKGLPAAVNRLVKESVTKNGPKSDNVTVLAERQAENETVALRRQLGEVDKARLAAEAQVIALQAQLDALQGKTRVAGGSQEMTAVMTTSLATFQPIIDEITAQWQGISARLQELTASQGKLESAKTAAAQLIDFSTRARALEHKEYDRRRELARTVFSDQTETIAQRNEPFAQMLRAAQALRARGTSPDILAMYESRITAFVGPAQGMLAGEIAKIDTEETARMGVLDHDLETLQGEAATITGDLSRAESDIQALMAQKQGLAARLETLKSGFSPVVEGLMGTLRDIKEAMRRLGKDLDVKIEIE